MTSALCVAAIGLILFTYLGYPLVCFARARWRPRPIQRRPIRRSVSVLLAAWREERTIEAKLENLAELSYPSELLEIIIVCDGSDDGTVEVARAAAARLFGERAQVIALAERRGKSTALNVAAAAARGELLVFTDARQRLCGGAVAALVENFGDPEVGAVGGELTLLGPGAGGAYWRYETLIRRLEARAGSTVGVSGALHALRRELFTALPPSLILDDLWIPLRVRMAGYRVALEPRARAFDRVAPTGREFQRKVRTLSGNFQLIALSPGALSPFANPAWFELVAHKLLRLAVPYLLAIALVTSAILPGTLARLALVAQLLIYALAGLRALGVGRSSRLLGMCHTFVVLNAAAVVGLGRFLRRGRNLPW